MHEAELQMCLRPPLCPPGLVYPTDSEFISRLRELEKNDKQGEQIPLIPSTVKELEDMLKLCCFTPINLPRPVQIQIKSLYRLHTTSYTVHYKDTSAAMCAYTSILQRVLLLQYLGNTDWHCVCVCVARLYGVSLTTGFPTMVSTKKVSLLILITNTALMFCLCLNWLARISLMTGWHFIWLPEASPVFWSSTLPHSEPLC